MDGLPATTAAADFGGGEGDGDLSSPDSIPFHSNETPSLPSPSYAPPSPVAAGTTSSSSSTSAKTARAWKAGEGSGQGRGVRTDSGRRRREARKRPAWWQPQEKGSYRCVLSLRPADALPGAVPGEEGRIENVCPFSSFFF